LRCPTGTGPSEVIVIGWVLFGLVGLLWLGAMPYGADGGDSMKWRPIVGVPPRRPPYRDPRPRVSPWRDIRLLADGAGARPRVRRRRLSWIAAATSRIRVATRVLALPNRAPAMVAKMAETFDRLSGGRLILGLGGGYIDDEFRAFGLGTFSPRDKVDGMQEAIRIVRGLWSERSFSFAAGSTGPTARTWSRSLSTASRSGSARIGPRADTHHQVGPPDMVAKRLVGLAKMGFGGFSLVLAGPDDGEQVALLASEVLPEVRAAV
jgi:Luciferase-like monooxygenase